MRSFLRRNKKRCGACGDVIPKDSATVEYGYVHNGKHQTAQMPICDACEKVMEAISHERGVGTGRLDTVDED